MGLVSVCRPLALQKFFALPFKTEASRKCSRLLGLFSSPVTSVETIPYDCNRYFVNTIVKGKRRRLTEKPRRKRRAGEEGRARAQSVKTLESGTLGNKDPIVRCLFPLFRLGW